MARSDAVVDVGAGVAGSVETSENERVFSVPVRGSFTVRLYFSNGHPSG